MIELLQQLFYSPQWLWLIPSLLPLVLWDSIRTWGQAGVGRRIMGGFVRVLMLSALAAALADPRWHRNDPGRPRDHGGRSIRIHPR